MNDDGDIYNEDNLVEFRRHVLELTDDKGVHFVMADGVSFKASIFLEPFSVLSCFRVLTKS